MKKIGLLLLLLSVTLAAETMTVRLKDMSRLENVRDNQLIGYGLVIGLAGTGDGNGNKATLQGISNMLSNFGVQIDPDKVNAGNVAAVIVTAKIGPFNVAGDAIDVEVSSIGKAKSLRGGILLLTPLKAANGEVYAVAQGAVSLGGGFSVSSKGSSQSKNHATSGRIPDGATVEKSVNTTLAVGNKLTWVLAQEDFRTMDNVRQVIQKRYPEVQINVQSASKFTLTVPDRYRENVVQLISMIGDLEVGTDSIAKIVINEKTGSIVMGGPVKISPVAIAHADLNISIKSTDTISQPNPLSGGTTTLVKGAVIEVEPSSTESNRTFNLLHANNTIEDLVSVLNNIGVTPSDTIAILQLMKEAGAIKAKLEII